MEDLIIECRQCGKKNRVFRHIANKGEGVFCNQTCFKQYRKDNKKKPNVKCASCDKPFYKNSSQRKASKSGLFFCCRTCKDRAQRIGGIKEFLPTHYGTSLGSRGTRKRLGLLKKCDNCGYDKIPSILEVHHSDRDRNNNDISNLITLCPNCHQEEHFKHKDGRFKGKKKQVDRPSKELLMEKLKTSNYTAIGREYGVIGKTIKTWIE